ncbi:protein CDV3 homolog [Copidosoma floridanum]|uniref:protein CDV3 homolog n=1 Tax=Copidosoma floridanum TaxID=29053 RepID=UPI0006C9C468|nr:protein CDV3 homolog [Copidosoma floridanum]XP_014212005.1 protein CDV3 homolog [Copidosoma floridanum]
MADLDDFFAKKDRKKAKGKKFTTTDEIARKLEETGKKTLEKPKPKEKPENSEGNDDNQQIEEEDEWKEFKEEKKDYSGLKIGNLTVSETNDRDVDDDRGTGENASDQESGELNKNSGPWKKTDNPPPPAPEPEPAQQSSKVVGGVYRPPGLRNPQPDAPLRRHRAKNVAPDINSEEYFPTLNAKPATNDVAGVWGKKKKDEGNFEEVRNRGGTRTYNTPEAQDQAPKLSLGNKYGALSQDQS